MIGVDTKERNRNKSVQVLERGIAILEQIAENKGESSLAALSKNLAIPRSTIHRLLSSLMGLGYIEQDPVTGHYRMGLKILSLSSAVLENLDIRRIAHEYLRDLMEETGETANLVVLDRNEVVYLEKVERNTKSRNFALIGHRAPVHVTGAGKVLLSEMAQMDVIEILRAKGMPRLTKNSITEIDVMLDELAKARKQGFAFDNQECETDARCIAAPVRNHTGRIVAAMSISSSISRISLEMMGEIAPIVIKHALRLSQALGFSNDLLKLKT